MIGQVYPTPEQMTEQQEQRLAEQQEQQRVQNQLMMIQIDHAERDQIRKDKETIAKLFETSASIKKIESEITLNLEKAETEDVKNQLNKYTTQVQGITAAIDNTLKELGRDDAERLSPQNTATQRIASDNTRQLQ